MFSICNTKKAKKSQKCQKCQKKCKLHMNFFWSSPGLCIFKNTVSCKKWCYKVKELPVKFENFFQVLSRTIRAFLLFCSGPRLPLPGAGGSEQKPAKVTQRRRRQKLFGLFSPSFVVIFPLDSGVANPSRGGVIDFVSEKQWVTVFGRVEVIPPSPGVGRKCTQKVICSLVWRNPMLRPFEYFKSDVWFPLNEGVS